jgi:hypothetical protein
MTNISNAEIRFQLTKYNSGYAQVVGFEYVLVS